MKRISFLMITLLMTISMVMAQRPQRGERKQMDPKERAEKRTDRMATEYGLNDTQKAKLLELNISATEKVGDRPAQRKQNRNQTVKRKTHETYQAGLKEIFTTEQYQKFQANQAERQKKMKENRKDGKDRKDWKNKRGNKQRV